MDRKRMESLQDPVEEMLCRLVASTRSPRGRYSASESWKLLEKRLVAPPAKRRWLFRLSGAIAASVLLCVAGWLVHDYGKPAVMQTFSTDSAISVVTLPDRTKVTLNRYSSLTYPDRFKGEKRIVRLSGEAYFEVAKDVEHPFVVKADPVEIQVLGTHFNVDAYPDDAQVKTILFEGSVAVRATEPDQRLVLSPGESAVYNRNDNTLLGEEVTEKGGKADDWRDGHFRFDYLPLQEIARELSNAFRVKIKITDDEIRNYRIRAHFTKGESLNEMLDLLQSAGNFSYVKTKDTILISPKHN